MTDPIEPEDTEHGVAMNEEAPVTERPSPAAPHPADASDPTGVGTSLGVSVAELDPEATVNLTGGDFEATVNLSGGTIVIPQRDDHEGTPKIIEPDDTAEANDVTRGHLKGLLEALVFASDKPIKAGELAKTATAPTKQVKELLEELRTEYAERGMQLDEVAGGWIFRTNAAYAPFVRDLTKQRPVKLTRAQIETLAILAYRQPITRPEVDEIRGVDCGPVLKVLLERDLVRVLGKKDEPGRPWLYGTTTQFLEFFGLKSLRDLPTLREFTELNEESRRTVEKELGETLSAAEEAAAVAPSAEVPAEDDGRLPLDMAGDTLPPDMLPEDAAGDPSTTEIPPARSTSDDVEADANAEPSTAKDASELDPEDEFPDDDDADFDDEDEDDEEDAEEEEDEEDE